MVSAPRTLTLAAELANLAAIGEFVTRLAAEAGLDNRQSYAVQMAVDEACSNIVEHAYIGQSGGEINISGQIVAAGLEITLLDQGRPFDPDNIPRLNPSAPLEERRRRGMGLFFIEQLMDRVEYQFNTPHGNRLILFKHR